jgi:NADPH:quinone reductase-like Zn-dependent oxidoreductase
MPVPEAGEVLIRVKAAAINPVDWKIQAGGYGNVQLPATIGRDMAGVIEAVGPGVTTWRVGDEVYGVVDHGSFAHYTVAPAQVLGPKPASVDFVLAAAIPLAAMTAWQAVFDHGHLGRGQTILIHAAAGGVGSFAVQLAKWRGARVIGTASAEHLDYLRELGVDQAIDYHATRFEDVVNGVDMVLDPIGGETQERSWGVIKRGGVLVSLVQPPSPQRSKETGVRGEIFHMTPSRSLLEEIAGLVDEGKLRPFVSDRLPFTDYRKAEELSKTHHTMGKIVLEVETP